MNSLRARLVLGLVLSVAALSALAGLVLVAAVRHRAIDDFDTALAAQVRGMAPMVRRDEEGHIDVRFDRSLLKEFGPHRARRADYFQVSAPGVLVRSPSMNNTGSLQTTGDSVIPVTLPDGRPGRAFSLRFHPSSGDPEDAARVEARWGAGPLVTLTVARNTHPIDEMMEVVWSGIALAAAVMALGVGAVVWIVVGRGLRPIARLAADVRSIHAHALDKRFPETAAAAELRPIVHGLNQLLARLESAFARERRFTSAAAHELRTPIAELLAMAEVGEKWGENPQVRQRMTDVASVARRMESIVESLLALARQQQGRAPAAQRQPVDLAPLIDRVWDGIVAGPAGARGVTLQLQQRGNPLVLADPAMIEVVLRNLLENAADHATPHSLALCSLTPGCLEITNPQTALTPEDLPHLFEPFWRKDPARSPGANHIGLGLALVRAYVAAMSGSIEAHLTPTQHLLIRLHLPHSPTPPTTPPHNAPPITPTVPPTPTSPP